MRLRRAKAADQAALRAMMATSDGYAEGPPRAMIVAYAAAWTVRETSDEEIWLLEDARGIAGFWQTLPHPEDGIELDLFFTANDRRGEGVGRRLFAGMAERVRELGFSRLRIVSNPPAAGFYRAMGCVEVGTCPPLPGLPWERPIFSLPLETGTTSATN